MNDTYQSPFNARYASAEMSRLFSPDMRYTTWRKLWVALAESEMELGLPITQAQVDALKAHIEPIDYEVVAAKEKEIRHDVMAHVYAYGQDAPEAKGIIHLGATSCYVTDNADLIIYREALRLVRGKLLAVAERLSRFALAYQDMPQLGYTHLQPAQLVTVGKRATLWIQELMMDLDELDCCLASFKLLGCKGTTGTQASFMDLFENDEEKCKQLDAKICQKMGFESSFPVSGQTYPRKFDSRILSTLSSIAQSASKFANDLRLLQHMREVEEPFEKSQVGSSAMAYKRNPMRSERICSMARHVIALAMDPPMTASVQWMERTLDDSANRRICMPEAFLSIDAVLELYANIADGMVVYPQMIQRHVEEQLPFMATENILMEAVKHGGDRQELHEKLRVHSQAAAAVVKGEGKPNDLLERIAADPAFGLTLSQLQEVMDARLYIGRCPNQVVEFIQEQVLPRLSGAAQGPIGQIRV